MYQEV